ncbi:hypothetical protein [Brachybacterium sp. AOP29-B2-41]|uniref:hypothetical protein n=1 Tax=Brachybacterium sp. AOP29-B2-41 TaxID=3457704 RepID=UPI0040337F42
MDSEVEGFSETGLIVFGATLGGLALLVLVAAFLMLLFARRRRLLKSFGVAVGGSLLGTPLVVIAAVVATMV